VEETLKNNPKLRTEREIYLHAARKLPYGDVIQVMAMAKLAGAERMGLVTDPME
jgi:biopolymer transport protein ExbD